MQQGTVKKDAQGLPGGSRVLKSSNSSDWRNLRISRGIPEGFLETELRFENGFELAKNKRTR